MKSIIKKISVVVLSVLLLVVGSLGSVSSAYAISANYQLPDPYVMDAGYRNLLEYKVLGYKDNMSDALKVVEDHADWYSPRRHAFKNSFNNGHELIEFLIQFKSRLEKGIYVFEVGHYHHKGSYFYILSLKNFFQQKVPVVNSKPNNQPPDPYIVDQDNQSSFNYDVLDYKEDLNDALKSIEGFANKSFPRKRLHKDGNNKFPKSYFYPQSYFYHDVYYKEAEYENVFKNGYVFIEFLKQYRRDFERGIYIVPIGNYYNGGSYFYIINFY